ncbi:MAG: xanthine dehydrogenase family protein subunit M [Congregibacter sp.]
MSLFPSFARPNSLQQATDLLSSLASGAVIIAGGQEIMPSVNRGVLQPDVYVDIGSIKELRGIEMDADSGQLAIGALTVHRELQTDELVKQHAPLLALAAHKAGGGRQVHNRGTIGGNIVAMHPLYDISPSLLALEADVEMLKDGVLTRSSLASLLTDTRHGLGSDAILLRVLIAPCAPAVGYGYEKLKMSGGAYGSANAAAIVAMDGPQFESVRLSIGAVSERLIDATAAANFLQGQRWSPAAAEQLKTAVSSLVTEPLSDQQGNGDWRTAMAGVVAVRACTAAVELAQVDGLR